MVSADSKRVLPDLKKLCLGQDYKNPMDWMPRGGQTERPLSPGLTELTRKAPKVGMIGVNDKDFAKTPKCRFCGSDMFIVDETEEAIVMGCAYEFCPNNPDSPMSSYFYQRAKRRIGRIMEDQF